MLENYLLSWRGKSIQQLLEVSSRLLKVSEHWLPAPRREEGIVLFISVVVFWTGLYIVLAVLDYIDQAILEQTDPPAAVSQVLGLKVCATTSGLNFK